MKAVIFAILCAIVSMVFCETMHIAGSLYKKYFPNVYVEENGEYKLVREAWGAEEYSQKSVIG